MTFFIPALSFSFSHQSYCSNLARLPVICLLSAHLSPPPLTLTHTHTHFLLLTMSFLLVLLPFLSTRSTTLLICQLLTFSICFPQVHCLYPQICMLPTIYFSCSNCRHSGVAGENQVSICMKWDSINLTSAWHSATSASSLVSGLFSFLPRAMVMNIYPFPGTLSLSSLIGKIWSCLYSLEEKISNQKSHSGSVPTCICLSPFSHTSFPPFQRMKWPCYVQCWSFYLFY